MHQVEQTREKEEVESDWNYHREDVMKRIDAAYVSVRENPNNLILNRLALYSPKTQDQQSQKNLRITHSIQLKPYRTRRI